MNIICGFLIGCLKKALVTSYHTVNNDLTKKYSKQSKLASVNLMIVGKDARSITSSINGIPFID